LVVVVLVTGERNDLPVRFPTLSAEFLRSSTNFRLIDNILHSTPTPLIVQWLLPILEGTLYPQGKGQAESLWTLRYSIRECTHRIMVSRPNRSIRRCRASDDIDPWPSGAISSTAQEDGSAGGNLQASDCTGIMGEHSRADPITKECRCVANHEVRMHDEMSATSI